jgi:hypothetical protein
MLRASTRLYGVAAGGASVPPVDRRNRGVIDDNEDWGCPQRRFDASTLGITGSCSQLARKGLTQMTTKNLLSLGLTCAITCVLLVDSGCGDDDANEVGLDEVGDGDGDPTGTSTMATTEGMDGVGDGDPPSEGDGEGDGDPPGEGDGDGDGDGDPPGEGDGDGDPPGEGDGDGDPPGDGDGHHDPTTTTTTTTGNIVNCQAPAQYVDCDGTPGKLTTNPFQAIGINCGDDPSSTIVATKAKMHSLNADAWAIATGFGTAAGPRYESRLWAANSEVWLSPNDEEIPANTSTALLILSTGIVNKPSPEGVVTHTPSSQLLNGDNGNLDGGGLPAPLSALRGSNGGAGGAPFTDCDLVNDCSDSLHDHWYENNWDKPHDKLWMQMELTVPAGVEGYIFDFAYFSSEYPAWVNTPYNDMFIAWSTSESYTGNITFVNDAPLTITSLEDAGAFQYKGQSPALAGTGFEGHAGTGWFVARGSAAPLETFQLTFFIADMADSILATKVLLDNFRWECAGCIPSEVNSCGIVPQ